jgi:hypothetical protein
MVKKVGRSKGIILIICINFVLYLPFFILFFSCALSQQQAMIAAEYEKQKKQEQKELKSAYYVKIVCPENAEKYVGTKYLEFPYSIQLSQGQTQDFILYYPETGVKYGGELYGMTEDKEGFGKYPGYELCITDSLLREADTGGKLVFYLRSPRGETMVRVTVWRSR